MKLIAMADVFRDRFDTSCKTLEAQFKEKVDVSEANKFVGLNAYKDVLETDADTVLLVTPPGFRPMMFEAAVKAGKMFSWKSPSPWPRRAARN